MNKRRRNQRINSIVYGKKKNESTFMNFIFKVMITLCMFLAFQIVFKDNQAKTMNEIFSGVITKLGNIVPFEQIIYGDTQTVFMDTELDIIDTKEFNNGYVLFVKENEIIKSFENGIVSGNTEIDGYGKILSIQQSDGVEIWFGNLMSNDLNIYDFVKKGDIIGQVAEDELFIAIKKNGEFITYEQYQQIKD